MKQLSKTPMKVGIAKLTQSGDYVLESLADGPNTVEQGGLWEVLEESGCVIVESKTAELTAEERNQYGTRHLLGLASRHLADIVAGQPQKGLFTIGLLPSCSGLMGMLAGFQMSGPSRKPLRVGLVWLDAHADINTPETSLSGLLAGMPVAVATGLCLERLRLKCGMELSLPTKHVTMVGVRDVDLLEQEIIDESEIGQITVDDIGQLRPIIKAEMSRLGSFTDIVYIHLDLDVLDPSEVPGHGLTVEGGPTSKELGAAFEVMFEHPKARGIGIAGFPVGSDPDNITLKALYHLIERAILAARKQSLP
ncbi:MAG: arginase family protein [Candidatus Thorarchaeota archaeon]|jgi:arginase